MSLTIWVDADAAPRAVKEILFRASRRLSVPVVLVANRAQAVPRGSMVRCVVVSAGMDVADDTIVERCVSGDIVVSADVPLAARVVEKGGVVIDPRGEVLDALNVGQRLSVRDFMEDMRASGLAGGGPPPFGVKDRERFANALDRLLARRAR